MDDKPDEDIERLRLKLELFQAEHRFLAWILAIILFGPSVRKSTIRWFQAKREGRLLDEEAAELIAAIVRRLIRVGFIGLMFPGGLLVWQNFLISSQNRYFRESASELRRQNAIQDERTDVAKRRELIGTIYSHGEQQSLRSKAESVISLVQLERGLIDRQILPGRRVRLRRVDIGCREDGVSECADLSGAPLSRVDFSQSNLRGINLSGADLRGSSFIGADLSGANLAGAKLQYARFREDISIALSLPLAVLAKNIQLARLREREARESKEEREKRKGKERREPKQERGAREESERIAAFEVAAGLRKAWIGGHLESIDSESWQRSISRNLRVNLDSATSAARVDRVDWGSANGWLVNSHTRLPLTLSVVSPTEVVQ